MHWSLENCYLCCRGDASCNRDSCSVVSFSCCCSRSCSSSRRFITSCKYKPKVKPKVKVHFRYINTWREISTRQQYSQVVDWGAGSVWKLRCSLVGMATSPSARHFHLLLLLLPPGMWRHFRNLASVLAASRAPQQEATSNKGYYTSFSITFRLFNNLHSRHRCTCITEI